MAQEMIKEYIQPQLTPSIDYQRLVFLAAGGSGIVYAVDDKTILKEYYDQGTNVERRVFDRLGIHANIIRCLGVVSNGLILERGQSLRTLIQKVGTDPIPLNQKICWLQEAAEGMRHMHSNEIIHADVGCHNWVIVQEHLKIIDFEECSIDGEEAGTCYEWFSYKESLPDISPKTDIFAFGCAIYEVIRARNKQINQSRYRGLI